MKRLLVLIDTTVGGTTGGAETHIWNFLSRLDQSQYSVDVIYFDTDDMDSDVIDSTKGKIAGIDYHRIPVRRVYAPSSFKYLKEIYQIMKKGEYDCAMSFFETSDVIVATLGKLAGIKMRISNRRDTGFRNSKKLALAYRYLNKLFTGFIAVSSAVKDSIVEQGVEPDKIQIIYNAVDIHRFEGADGNKIRQEIGIRTDEIVFGLVANLHPVKNHVAIIDALSELHQNDKKAHLVLVGDGKLRKELESQTESLGLSNYVHFLGARFDIENILDSMDAFVLASLTEGLSNALLEAMASKKAVIATRVGGNVEVVEDGVDGLLVSTDAPAIAKAMNQLMDSEKTRQEMGMNALGHIKRQFSIEQMMSIYTSLLNVTESPSGLTKHTTRPAP